MASIQFDADEAAAKRKGRRPGSFFYLLPLGSPSWDAQEKGRTQKTPCQRQGNGLPVDGAERLARNDEETRDETGDGRERDPLPASGIARVSRTGTRNLQIDAAAAGNRRHHSDARSPSLVWRQAGGPLGGR